MYTYVNNNLYFLGNLFDRPINVKPVIFFLYAGVLSKLPNPLEISFLGVPIYYPFRASALSTFNISIYAVNPNYFKSPRKWIQQLRSIRTPCMENEIPPRLLNRNLTKSARDHPPATTRDAWFAAHLPTM